MQRNIISAIFISLVLSGCATYRGADGQSHYADPSICSADGICPLLIIAMIAGIGAAVATHR